MVSLLGGDRSFRRLLLFFVCSYLTLALFGIVAMACWLVWMVVLYIGRHCSNKDKENCVVWHNFVRQVICVGFLPWLCQWEMRIRNIYAIKLYIDPNHPVVLEPYIRRVAVYFLIWKMVEMGFGVSLIFFFLQPFSGCRMDLKPIHGHDHDLDPDHIDENIIFTWQQVGDCPDVTELVFVVISFPIILRIVAWLMTKSCEYYISPVFQLQYDYVGLTDIDDGEEKDYHDFANKRIAPQAPLGESSLGLSVIPHPIGDYCIPVPLYPLKDTRDEIPMLEQRNQNNSPSLSHKQQRDAEREILMPIEITISHNDEFKSITPSSV
ncbi:hypothetical protein THRCLA_10006 [Thraustotheca clavata]|uniref:Transmembrane protein n=1 Tax=Thraustotheca clavata TaxID=74557 RepID=A0A1V9YSZ3_9STRA|nr:hypothetical protein THRCLA_10006 [Thraustotheca clavata]